MCRKYMGLFDFRSFVLSNRVYKTIKYHTKKVPMETLIVKENFVQNEALISKDYILKFFF